MESDKLTAWQTLHRRVVSGESLSPDEQAEYETGCAELDAEENLDGNLVRLRELRALIVASEAEQSRLLERQAKLDTRIAELESRLDARTRRLLGIGV